VKGGRPLQFSPAQFATAPVTCGPAAERRINEAIEHRRKTSRKLTQQFEKSYLSAESDLREGRGAKKYRKQTSCWTRPVEDEVETCCHARLHVSRSVFCLP
jgi:hypothetical protein